VNSVACGFKAHRSHLAYYGVAGFSFNPQELVFLFWQLSVFHHTDGVVLRDQGLGVFLVVFKDHLLGPDSRAAELRNRLFGPLFWRKGAVVFVYLGGLVGYDTEGRTEAVGYTVGCQVVHLYRLGEGGLEPLLLLYLGQTVDSRELRALALDIASFTLHHFDRCLLLIPVVILRRSLTLLNFRLFLFLLHSLTAIVFLIR
jgi:hypothetical protein